jgi:hypothetical protein
MIETIKGRNRYLWLRLLLHPRGWLKMDGERNLLFDGRSRVFSRKSGVCQALRKSEIGKRINATGDHCWSPVVEVVITVY